MIYYGSNSTLFLLNLLDGMEFTLVRGKNNHEFDLNFQWILDIIYSHTSNNS